MVKKRQKIQGKIKDNTWDEGGLIRLNTIKNITFNFQFISLR